MSDTTLTPLLHQTLPFAPEHATVTTAALELPPGDPGTPSHRHSEPMATLVSDDVGARRHLRAPKEA